MRNSAKTIATFASSLEHWNKFQNIKRSAEGKTLLETRPSTITRKELDWWHQNNVNRDNTDSIKNHGGVNKDLELNYKNPETGMVQSFPTWLTSGTNAERYRTGVRATYDISTIWKTLDEWRAGSTNRAISQKEYAAALMAANPRTPNQTNATPESQIEPDDDQDDQDDMDDDDLDDSDDE